MFIIKKNRPPKTLYAVIISIACIIALIMILTAPKPAYRQKSSALKQEVQRALQALNVTPSNGTSYVVFLSVSDGEHRADIYTGSGSNFSTAYNNADRQALQASQDDEYPVKYIKCDVVYDKVTVTPEQFAENLKASMPMHCFYGIAFDSDFRTAFLESECNAAGIYDYETGILDINNINRYLSAAGRDILQSLPNRYILFETYSWFCDEDNKIVRIDTGWGGEADTYGRREINNLDSNLAAILVQTGTDYLRRTMDLNTGKFHYNNWPQFDRNSEDYNIIRHAGVIWALVNYYKMTGDMTVQAELQRAIEYLLSQVKPKDSQTAYLYDVNQGIMTLGGNGLSVIALTEYMQAFNSDEYLDVCKQLGNGILTCVNPETHGFRHVISSDFEIEDEYVTIYYDGEAALALSLLYNLTQDTKYLEAAVDAAEYFIENHYEIYGDHWISYAMNELTRIYPNEDRYYMLALHNIQNSIPEIQRQVQTSPVSLELLMAGFEAYQRYAETLDPDLSWLDLDAFLCTIRLRADNQLNGYFWPEYAMYMACPDKILGSFYTRSDSFRIRMDDIQHNIGGYYLYWKNYEALVAAGMPERLGK